MPPKRALHLTGLRSPLNAMLLPCLKFVTVVAVLTVAMIGAVARADGLIVYGDKWAFSVAEPTGWHGDIQLAVHFQANIVFLPEDVQSKAANVTIRVRVNYKTDEDLAKDLRADMEEYRAKFPEVIFTDLALSHPSYLLVSKLMSVPNEFFEYVAYVNPGKEYPYVLSVAMSKTKDPASSEELLAFRKVLDSLRFMRKTP